MSSLHNESTADQKPESASGSQPVSNNNDTSSISSDLRSLNSEQQASDILIQEESNKIFEHLIKEMIESSGDYIKSEIDTCIADYSTLEKMNRTVIQRYKEVSKHTAEVSAEMIKLNESYAILLPMLSQIDEVEKCVASLEQTTAKLDNYSKRLEAKFKQFTEKYLADK